MKNNYLRIMGNNSGQIYVIEKAGTRFVALKPVAGGTEQEPAYDNIGESYMTLDQAIEVIEDCEIQWQNDKWEQWGEARLFGVNG